MAAITPDLFHIDYERLLETLVCIVVFSFFVERVLAVIFESRIFIDWSEGKPAVKEKKKNVDGIEEEVVITEEIPKKKGIRELISVIVSICFCLLIKFDAITIILQSNNKMTFWGMVFTGFIISGGSKASIALFQNVMGVMSSAEQMRKANAKKQNQ
jgi:hypothetical protein